MISMSTGFFTVCGLCIFGLGLCIGAMIVIELTKKKLIELEESLEKIEADYLKQAHEYEEFVKTRELIDAIDDVPEYLRGKYRVPGKQSGELEEDLSAMYT